jgi:hypothetical protein
MSLFGVRLSRRSGRVVAGLGGGRVSLDNVAFAEGGEPFWLNAEDDIIYASTSGGNDVGVMIRHANGTTTPALNPDGTPVKPANELAAGGGRWARWRTGVGLTDSTGLALPSAGLLDVGPDATLYYNVDRDHGIRARRIDGTDVEILPFVRWTALWLTGVEGGCVWTDYNLHAHTWNLPTPVTVEGEAVFCPSAFFLAGRWWICYLTQTRILAHYIDDPEYGYEIAIGDRLFYPHAIAFNGKIRCAYSVTSGAQPGNQRVVTIDPTSPRVKLRVPAPLRPLDAPVLSCCFFADSVRYGSDPAAPGTGTIVVETGLMPNRPTIIARSSDEGVDLINEYRRSWDRVRGIYITTERGDLRMQADAARARMKQLGLAPQPIISYTGSTLPADLSMVDVRGLQCYQEIGEPLSTAEHRWRNQVQGVGATPYAIVGGIFDRRSAAGRLPVADLRGAIPIYLDLARSPWCRGIYLFAWGRPGGGRDYGLGPDVQRLVDAAGTPAIAGPSITITSYSPAAGKAPLEVVAVWDYDGISGPVSLVYWLWRRTDSSTWNTANPTGNPPDDRDHHFRFTQPGRYEIAARAVGPGGAHQTGRQRLVLVA